MVKLKFFRDEKENVLCKDVDGGTQFRLNADTHFENRQYLFLKQEFPEQDFFFDGYSIYFESTDEVLKSQETFTVSMCFIPFCASSGKDGLISYYDAGEKRGILIALCKDGTVQITLGNGRASDTFVSINSHVLWNVRNVITVVYRGDAGWCDLYINGVLSNRRQFARHLALQCPDGKVFLGKYVDGSRRTEHARGGCFFGFLSWVSFEDRALAAGEVMELHREHFSGAVETKAVAAGTPNRAAYSNDRNRPRYHLIAPGKWMNEPHGPVFFGGWYHIFYQANPHAPLWDHIMWGHLASRDMVHWEDCPSALCPDPDGLDADGCWSGSCMIDKNGIPRIYYTAGNDRYFPNQGVAMAVPESVAEDSKLARWKKRGELVQKQNIGWLGEFRDPFVWLEGDTYFMLVGTGDAQGGGGNAALYSSSDGIQWESHGFLVDYDDSENRETGHVWELPALLPLRDETGEVKCHILLLCACQIEDRRPVETYYFMGNWNPAERTFTKLHDKAKLLDLGHGTFTGSCGFVTPDMRSVFFTIAQGRRGLDDEFHSGWAHNGGLPLELSVKGDVLRYRPIRELDGLKQKKLLELTGLPSQAVNEGLRSVNGDCLCMELVVSGDYAAVKLQFGDDCREVYYDRHTCKLGARDRSGNEIGIWRGAVDDVNIGDEAIRFTCYLDCSMLEVYVNDVKSITLRNYTRGTRTFQIDERTGEIDSMELWEMVDTGKEYPTN